MAGPVDKQIRGGHWAGVTTTGQTDALYIGSITKNKAGNRFFLLSEFGGSNIEARAARSPAGARCRCGGSKIMASRGVGNPFPSSVGLSPDRTTIKTTTKHTAHHMRKTKSKFYFLSLPCKSLWLVYYCPSLSQEEYNFSFLLSQLS
jgi:hypothetical protein